MAKSFKVNGSLLSKINFVLLSIKSTFFKKGTGSHSAFISALCKSNKINIFSLPTLLISLLISPSVGMQDDA